MNKIIILLTMAIVLSAASFALALDSAALVGTWKLVEPAKDAEGKNCPFVGQQIQFTADGKMISAMQSDWSKAPIVYGVSLKNKQFTMKVSGYTPALYKKLK
jgi:hypothetical protein